MSALLSCLPVPHLQLAPALVLLALPQSHLQPFLLTHLPPSGSLEFVTSLVPGALSTAGAAFRVAVHSCLWRDPEDKWDKPLLS